MHSGTKICLVAEEKLMCLANQPSCAQDCVCAGTCIVCQMEDTSIQGQASPATHAHGSAFDSTGSLSILPLVQMLSPGPGGGPVGDIGTHLRVIPP
eukprot:428374-Pelagomonas_calceolata.AAC.2